MKSCIVLGAGMVGVATAIALRRRGWDVVLVDRRDPGRETSYGNAGIIQREAVRPYAMPRDITSLWDIALGLTNDVRYRLPALPSHARALLAYWRNSAPKRHRVLSEAWASLIVHATECHDPLIRESGAEALVRRDGYFLMHRDPQDLADAVAIAKQNRDRYGVRFSVLTSAQFRHAEPSLRAGGAGVIHWEDPWCVSDPGGLVTAYVRLFEAEQGRIRRGDATTLVTQGAGWSVTTDDGPVSAEAVVVALGPWSEDFLRQFGYRFAMVRKRGYHRHYRSGAPLMRPVMDAGFGYVMAPMEKGIRITTGAELTGTRSPATPVQLGRAEAAARQLIDLGEPVETEPWYGTRPCMPDMLPVIGAAPRHKGLWFNFGHGHQGFTLGPATGRLLAELMTGETPFVDPFPYRPDR